MASQQKIKLYKVRSFSQKLNATIEFIRQNIKPLSKAIIYILGPLAILSGLLFSQYINFVFGNLNSQEMENFQNPLASVFNGSYVGFMLLSMFSALLNYSIVINYMKLYQERFPENITVTEILNISWRTLLPLFGLSLLSFMIIFFGFLAFIIPGIYLMIVLSIAIPVLFFEKGNILESVSRSFKLIKGKWWSTFGLLLVSSIIMYAISLLFIIPFYVFYFLGIFSAVEEVGISADVSAWWFQAGMTLSVIFMTLGSYLTTTIPVLALNFQYFNLVERQESVGLLGDIEQLDTEN